MMLISVYIYIYIIIICLSKIFEVRIIGNNLNIEEEKKDEINKGRKEDIQTDRQKIDTGRTYREV